MSENGLTKQEFEAELAALQDRRQQEGKAVRRYDSGPMTSYRSDQNRLAHQQGQRAAAWMESQQAQPLRFDAADLLDALPYAFMLRAGLSVHRAHPMAGWAAELPWPRLCEQLEIRSLTSSDFGTALATGYRQIVTSAYSTEDDCSPCFAETVSGDFRPVKFPVLDTIDLQAVSDKGIGIGSIPLQLLSTAPGESGQVQSYRARVMISRPILLNDDFALVTSLIRHLSAHAARLSGQRLGAILTANANLSGDNAPLCGSGNTTSATGYSLTALAEAAGKLRSVMSATGNIMNLLPAVWLVPAAGEIPARAALRQIELAGQSNFQLIVNPWQPSFYSYVLCDSAQQPTFARLLLDPPPLRPSVSRVSLPISYDGVALDVEISFGIQPVSRLGIVRIPTT